MLRAQLLPVETLTEQGLSIWSFPDDGSSRFVLGVLVGSGARDEGPVPRGVAHFLEHVVLARAGDRPKAAADPELRDRARAWNGYTSHETTVYWLETGVGDWRWAVQWLADHVVRPRFLPEDIDAEREIVRQELLTADPHAGGTSYESLLYPGHALGVAVGGEPADLDAIDGAQLQAFHAAHYRAGNVAVGFAGRVPTQECCSAIAVAFAPLPAGVPQRPADPVAPHAGVVVPRGAGSSGAAWMHVGWHLPTDTARDLACARILGAFLQQHLFAELRERLQISYSPSVQVIAHRDTQRIDCEVRVGEARALRTALDVIDDAAGALLRATDRDFDAARSVASSALVVDSAERLTAAMELSWLLRRRGQPPGGYVAATLATDRLAVLDYAERHLGDRARFVVASAPVGGGVSAWALLLLMAVVVLMVDAFGGFRRTRALGWLLRSVVGRRRGGDAPSRPRGRREPPRDPIRPVNADELEQRIQQWFEEEERKQ